MSIIHLASEQIIKSHDKAALFFSMAAMNFPKSDLRENLQTLNFEMQVEACSNQSFGKKNY